MAATLSYEEQLSRDLRWGLNEAGRHFSEDSIVFRAMNKITKRLSELGIPHAVVGGMALFRHGWHRFTEDVDILVTKEGLKQIHDNLDGLGYLPLFKNSKNLRDTELGVKIEFLTTGDFPGDGKPKPVAFPDPSTSSEEIKGISVITLPKFIELKLASGMTNPSRMKDLTDVLELIKATNLPLEFAKHLNPYVCDKFAELHAAANFRVHGAPHDEN